MGSYAIQPHTMPNASTTYFKFNQYGRIRMQMWLFICIGKWIPEIKLQLGFAKLFLLYIEMHIWNRSSGLKWNYIQGTISFARFSFFTHRLMHLVSKGYSWKCISFLDQWFWSNDSVGKIYSGFLMVPWIKREIVLKVFHSFIYLWY